MKIHHRVLVLSQAVLLLFLSCQLQAVELTEPETALETYLQQDDGAFNIQHLVSIPGAGYQAHLFNLTSQRWLTEAEVDRPLWTHSLVIIVPDTVNSTTGMLFVGDDDNDDPLPDGSNPVVQIITQLALGSQSIVSAVFQVPNQPLTFADDLSPRKEDDLTSYSWQRALDTGNYLWTAYLPMTKSVLKAMDGIQQVVPELGAYRIDEFILTGFSKRGAAVWLAASQDARVKAIAPGVIDLLNIVPSFEHHFKSYGAYSEAIQAYVDLGIMDKLRAPEFTDLAQVIDPYAYRSKLVMPKLILNASGDEFFLPDSSRFYLNDLAGDTLIRFAPNAGHSLSNSQTGVADSLYSLLGWYQTLLYGLPRPDIQWQISDGLLSASTSLPPASVRVWTATNPTARDFRVNTIGESWTSAAIEANDQGEYVTALAVSDQGFTATYIEFVYQGLGGFPVTYSTQVYVTPDIYPYTLHNPVFDPKPSAYWSRQLTAALKDRPADIDADTLQAYLPIPLFDDMIISLEDMSDALSIGHRGRDVSDRAERECLSTRLNIKLGEIGWYSSMDLGGWLGEKPLWAHYTRAHEAAEQGSPWLSSFICARINHQ